MNQQNVLQYSQNQNGPFKEYGSFKWLVLIKSLLNIFNTLVYIVTTKTCQESNFQLSRKEPPVEPPGGEGEGKYSWQSGGVAQGRTEEEQRNWRADGSWTQYTKLRESKN